MIKPLRILLLFLQSLIHYGMFYVLTKLFIITGKVLFYFVLTLVFIIYIEYITCPVYDFKPGQPFAGDKIYNPYQNMDPDNWHRGNFQIQSRAWGGITSGRGNSNEDIHQLYKSLGYDIIGTSDYMKINRFGEDKPGYVPVYEHGYNLKKRHQVLLGARKILWKDYPLFQTLHNKQHIINSLRDDNALIYLAHPLLHNSYVVNDMKILSNYDGIEVINNDRFSLHHWDAALSAGNYVTILGNDDAHDISNPDEIGHRCTFINSPSLETDDILQSLKTGNAFGAWIHRINGESYEDKIRRVSTRPKLLRLDVMNDTIFVEVDSLASYIVFIGQDEQGLKTVKQSFTGFYDIKKNDTYVRIEIHFPDKSIYCLNPVCRYDGISPAKMPLPQINAYKTWLLRIIGFATLGFLIFNCIVIVRKLREKRKLQ